MQCGHTPRRLRHPLPRDAASGARGSHGVGDRCRVSDLRRGGRIHSSGQIKGAITGISPDRPGFGTYEVNDDCTAMVHFQPGPGISLEERMVIVPGGPRLRPGSWPSSGQMTIGQRRSVRSSRRSTRLGAPDERSWSIWWSGVTGAGTQGQAILWLIQRSFMLRATLRS